MRFSPILLLLMICPALVIPACATADTEAASKIREEMVVTGVKMEAPLNVVTDPKAPRQPLPAQDGADYLKTIPGFSVIRKGEPL